ncbi:MAG: Rho termination factor N-terminal domain-containing protein [Acidimicrobiales bacterium]
MQRLQERDTTFIGSEMFDEIDRFLASIEERLPAVPAAGIKLQRAFNDRMRDVVADAAGRFRSSDDETPVEQTEKTVTDEDDTAATTDYAAMTRAELYELAQARDLEGRSSMNKAALVAALSNS